MRRLWRDVAIKPIGAISSAYGAMPAMQGQSALQRSAASGRPGWNYLSHVQSRIGSKCVDERPGASCRHPDQHGSDKRFAVIRARLVHRTVMSVTDIYTDICTDILGRVGQCYPVAKTQRP